MRRDANINASRTASTSRSWTRGDGSSFRAVWSTSGRPDRGERCSGAYCFGVLAQVCRKIAPWPASLQTSPNRRGERGDGQPCPERQAGDLGRDARGRPDRARRDRLRAADASARRGARAWSGSSCPELQNPIFPALAEVVAGALAQRGFNAVLCTRTGSMSEAEYVEMLLERQVSGMIFAGGQYAEADAPHDHYTRLLQAAPAGRARQRGRRAPRLSARLDRRRRRDGAGLRPSRLPRPRADRPDPRAARPRAVAPQARRVRAATRRGRGTDRSSSSGRRFSLEGGHAAATRLIERGVDRDHLRERPARARARSAPPGARACRSRRTSRSSATTTRRS